jgi:hypothetical protein
LVSGFVFCFSGRFQRSGQFPGCLFGFRVFSTPFFCCRPHYFLISHEALFWENRPFYSATVIYLFILCGVFVLFKTMIVIQLFVLQVVPQRMVETTVITDAFRTVADFKYTTSLRFMAQVITLWTFYFSQMFLHLQASKVSKILHAYIVEDNNRLTSEEPRVQKF